MGQSSALRLGQSLESDWFKNDDLRFYQSTSPQLRALGWWTRKADLAMPRNMFAAAKSAFEIYGPAQPHSPVVLSVPHAGRDYPMGFHLHVRHSIDRLIGLEDRHADLLAELAIADGHTCLVARVPRVWIDLNRDERDVDPAMLRPVPPSSFPLSAKTRGGLGLIPRRTAALGDIWRGPISADNLAARIENTHRPYHAALSQALDAAAARFGSTILIDLHSMPPLQRSAIGKTPRIVIGDRFGRSCHTHFAARVAGLAEAAGLHIAFNAPYAGGYILDRHGKPAKGIHAIQIEIDRTLYLSADQREPSSGLTAMQRLIAQIANVLADEIVAAPTQLAAE